MLSFILFPTRATFSSCITSTNQISHIIFLKDHGASKTLTRYPSRDRDFRENFAILFLKFIFLLLQQNGEKKLGLDYSAVSPDGGFELENKLMVKPRKTSRQGRRRTNNGGQLFETQHEHDDGTFVKLEATDQVGHYFKKHPWPIL